MTPNKGSEISNRPENAEKPSDPAYANQDGKVADDTYSDDGDPDGGDELKLSEEVADAERMRTPGGPGPTNRPKKTQQEN